MFNILFVVFSLIFVLLLPVFVAKLYKSDKTTIAVSLVITIAEIVCLVPLIIDRMGVTFPNFYMNVFDVNVGVWLFFINLFIVLLSNRKKLSK